MVVARLLWKKNWLVFLLFLVGERNYLERPALSLQGGHRGEGVAKGGKIDSDKFVESKNNSKGRFGVDVEAKALRTVGK